MYGIMTANGDAHFEDFCVSSDPGLLEDEIWGWGNSLAHNEPNSRVVPLFTRPAPAVPVKLPDDETLREMIRTWNRAPTPKDAWPAMREVLRLNNAGVSDE
ncbi:hypothetical protein [Erwinia sp. E_sp_B01_9]